MAIRPLIAGNWKMNGTGASLEELARLKTLLSEVGSMESEVLICPPATLVHRAFQLAEGSDILIGGQDCHFHPNGAHTGDVSAAMLVDAGAGHVILGHSERRADHGETNAIVKSKASCAIAAGLTPVICVGETLMEREEGRAEQVVGLQLAESLPADFGDLGIVVAYEPVWAIGTGKTATADDIKAMHGFIRSLLVSSSEKGSGARLLYGGSVKPDNAAAILATPEVNGALVGGASLKANDFFSILMAA